MGPADVPARRQAEDLHDLVTVQVGRIFFSSSCALSWAMRSSRPSWARASRAALALFRVVQSARVSTCSRVSSGPASRT